MNKDLDHLKTLSICFYVLAGLCLFPLLFGLLYLVIGIFVGGALMSADIPRHAGDPPPALFGGIFALVGGIIFLFALTFGILCIKAAKNLSKQQGYTFCFVIACLICLWMPLGTVLGVFTIIVLLRDSVKQLFNGVINQTGVNPPNWQ